MYILHGQDGRGVHVHASSAIIVHDLLMCEHLHLKLLCVFMCKLMCCVCVLGYIVCVELYMCVCVRPRSLSVSTRQVVVLHVTKVTILE